MLEPPCAAFPQALAKHATSQRSESLASVGLSAMGGKRTLPCGLELSVRRDRWPKGQTPLAQKVHHQFVGTKFLWPRHQDVGKTGWAVCAVNRPPTPLRTLT